MDKLLEFYKEEFLPAYSDLVGYLTYKPEEILIEVEHVFSHLMKYSDNDVAKSVQVDNLEKARNHLYRGTLDCYKKLWSEMKDDIDKIVGDKHKRKFGINMSEPEVLEKYNRFKEAAQEARKVELENVGENPIASMKTYRDAIKIGKEILGNIDHYKIEEFESIMWKFKTLLTAKEFLIGIITGVIAGIIIKTLF